MFDRTNVTAILNDCKSDLRLTVSEYLETPDDPRSEARINVDVGSFLRLVGLQISHDRVGNLLVRPPYTLAIQGGKRIPIPAIWFLDHQLKQKFDKAVEAALAEYHRGVNRG